MPTVSISDVEANFTPRYYAIEQALRDRIAKLHPGDALPSDAMLCDEFGVSRMTARNAVQRLAQEGLVLRIPGRGTFVAEPPVHRQAGNLLRFSEEMRRRGKQPSSRVLERRLRPASDAEAGRLGLRPGDAVAEVRRLRLADDEPIAVEDAVLRGDCFPAIEHVDLANGSLHAALVAAGCVPTAGRASIGAEAATAADAKLLRVKAGAALLVERRLIVDERGRPLELTESRYVGDRYGLDVNFDVDLPADAARHRRPARAAR